MMIGVIKRLAAILLVVGAAELAADTSVVWSAGPYAYDGAGNIKSIGTGETFVYDRLGRLISGTAGSGHLQEYTYDAFGNILSLTTDSNTASRRTPCVDAATNQIDRAGTDCNVSGTYDSVGNMTAYGTYATFVYDDLDMVEESTVNLARKAHLYNANDERIATIAIVGGQHSGSEWTIRDNGGRTLRRFQKTATGTWSWAEDYIYRDSALLAAEVPGAERTRHFHLDHLGTPRLITGSGGAEISRHTYYPFGQEATSSAQDTERAKFTGHERDDANLDYMHARYYLPYTGRFLSVDPVMDFERHLHKPQGWNRYSYVENNPINNTDPTGRCTVTSGSFVPCVQITQAVMGFLGEALYNAAANSGIGKIFRGAESGDMRLAWEGQAQLDHEIITGMMVTSMMPSEGSQTVSTTEQGEAWVARRAVQKSGERFFDKAAKGSENFRTEPMKDGSTKFSYDTPGRVPGSKATYQKTVDATGKTIDVKKTTYDPKGNVVHTKDKLIPQ